MIERRQRVRNQPNTRAFALAATVHRRFLRLDQRPHKCRLQRSRHRKHKFICASQLPNRLQHRRQNHAHFFAPAAWHQRDPRLRRVQPELRSIRFPRHRRRGQIRQRMPDKRRIHSAIAVELLLEREDDERLVHVLAQQLDSSLSPRPELGANVIHHRNAASAHLPRDAPVERRRVNHHRQIRPPFIGRAQQLLIEAENLRQMADDFRDADHRQILRVDNDLAAGSAHSLAARAKKCDLRICSSAKRPRITRGHARFERLHQLRAVHFAGRFPGRDQNPHPAIVRERECPRRERLCTIPVVRENGSLYPHKCLGEIGRRRSAQRTAMGAPRLTVFETWVREVSAR